MQQVRVRTYFKKIIKGTKEFTEGMNEQEEMLDKVINS